MGWPLVAGGGGGGGGGGGLTGVSGTATSGEIATQSTEDVDVDIADLEEGLLLKAVLTRTAGSCTGVALQLLDGDGNGLAWVIGGQFSGVDPSSAPLVGPRQNLSGANNYFPVSSRSATAKAHFRIYNKDSSNTGTFSVAAIVAPATLS